MKMKLEQELSRYLDSKVEFTPYYNGMHQIVCAPLFEEQLHAIMDAMENEVSSSSKSFKVYLDAVIVNMQSKIAKYKPSEYFDGEKIKEIENQGYLIPFYVDEAEEIYVLLGIYKKSYQ